MSSNTSSPRSQLAADILAAAAPLRELVGSLEPKDVPLSWAPEIMAAFAEVQRIGESGRVLMTSRAAEAGQWERERFASPADWLADALGTSAGRARADLETSERLGALDATSDAVREGRLSPEQAGVVADAAAVNPDAEADLLDQAQRDSLRRTRQEAERRKAEARSEQEQAERDARVRKDRRVRFWYANGAGNLEVRGPIAELKDLEQRIQREVDDAFRANRAPAQRASRANYAFDALIAMGRGVGGAGSSPAEPVGADSHGAGAGAEGRSRWPLRRLTLMRVDLGALRRGRTEVGEVCDIGGITVSVAELRRLLGDSLLQLVLTNGEAVIDVVNLNRKPTVAQMIAKLFTDAACSARGCDRAARLEFDHRMDWARVKVTEVANLDLLCDHHHDLKTYESWALTEGVGRRPMVPPTDRRHPRHRAGAAPDPPAADGLGARLARLRGREAEHRARRAGQDSLFDTG